ncbi:hypothetical protein PE067_18865 [Paracoccus sp. DMF-8]|uniref:hypothetical protein n=1 Tax=Paracoccus sp. DMF-8 TaxID=3019445 RepID=UPI0023E3707B|nr:hypothetical protein [Paracoccus sp. DMF-8]MDF3608006.1 hypothetical protein [Paracoccus sp. DMF-8]
MDSLLHPERLSEFRAISELIGIEMVCDPSVLLGQVIRQAGHTIDAYRHSFDEIAQIICSLTLWRTEGLASKIPVMVVFII